MRVLQLQGGHTWEDGCQILSRLPRPHIGGPHSWKDSTLRQDLTPVRPQRPHTRVSKALPAPVEHQGRHRQVTHRPTLRIHTTGTHVIQVLLALSATGSPSVPKIPQPGMKRSPPASPEKHRASKGLRALSFPWLSKTFGLLNLDEEHRLKAKKQALEESLADTATKPQRKAVVPSKEVVWALEEGASSLSTSGIIRPEGTMVPGDGTTQSDGLLHLGPGTFPTRPQCPFQ